MLNIPELLLQHESKERNMNNIDSQNKEPRSYLFSN